MSTYFGYKMLGVNPYSKNKEWAHKLAQYISNEDNQKLRFEMRGQGPSNIKAGKADEIKKSQAAQAILAQQTKTWGKFLDAFLKSWKSISKQFNKWKSSKLS